MAVSAEAHRFLADLDRRCSLSDSDRTARHIECLKFAAPDTSESVLVGAVAQVLCAVLAIVVDAAVERPEPDV